MDPNAGSNPVRGKFVRGLIGNSKPQVFQQVESAFEKANRVFRPDANR
jgi:hypothetical protein